MKAPRDRDWPGSELDVLRKEPRVAELVRKVGLAEESRMSAAITAVCTR